MIPQAEFSDVQKYGPHLSLRCALTEINTPLRLSAFIAQIAVESQYLARVQENLNYSAQGLANTWPSRYSSTGKRGGAPNVLALKLARDPKAIADYTYANRFGNGSIASGDGSKYAGKGLKQLTFLDNYKAYQAASGIPVVAHPELLLLPFEASDSAVWFWNRNRLSELADLATGPSAMEVFDTISRKVNGGDNGLLQRRESWVIALKEARAAKA